MLTGNREFIESYENYKNLILRTAYTYSGNREAAEDITQETFLKLYIGYDSMKKENIPSWLYTTAKNMALNYKKKAKWEVLAMDDDESAVPEPGTKSTEDEYQCHLDKDCFIVRNSYTADKHFVYLLYFYLITLLT